MPKKKKLTESLALDIREDTRSTAVVADAFGVSTSTVHDIRSGKSWRNAKREKPRETTERWKTIARYPDYDVSSFGRVRSRRMEKPRILCTPYNTDGFEVFTALTGRMRHTAAVHRCVLETFVGPCPMDGWVAVHLDGDKTNNRLDNLEWGKKRMPMPHDTKLTPEDIRAIRADTRLQKDIAAAFDIAQSQVSAIRNRRSWAWVTDEEEPLCH